MLSIYNNLLTADSLISIKIGWEKKYMVWNNWGVTSSGETSWFGGSVFGGEGRERMSANPTATLCRSPIGARLEHVGLVKCIRSNCDIRKRTKNIFKGTIKYKNQAKYALKYQYCLFVRLHPPCCLFSLLVRLAEQISSLIKRPYDKLRYLTKLFATWIQLSFES